MSFVIGVAELGVSLNVKVTALDFPAGISLKSKFDTFKVPFSIMKLSVVNVCKVVSSLLTSVKVPLALAKLKLIEFILVAPLVEIMSKPPAFIVGLTGVGSPPPLFLQPKINATVNNIIMKVMLRTCPKGASRRLAPMFLLIFFELVILIPP
ncbi:hypothetical protein, partial [Brachyspira aalborgi]|uniref:hypothetical protein n=1 Tax=Brachyspira aalborgi TaxID=29522 RepID=UPI00266D8D85